MSDNAPLIGRDARYEDWRWRVFFITWLAYVGFYLTRKSFAVAKIDLANPEIMGLTKVQLSLVDGAYLTTYAMGQFIWGMAGDRVGTRRVILCGMLASIVTAVLMGASNWVIAMGVLLAIQGFCQSTGWAPLAKNISQFFSQFERGRVMGFWCTNYAIGGFVASALAGWAIDTFGSWRFAFWVPAGVLGIIWILFIWLQRNRPEDVGLDPIEVYHGETEAVLEGDESAAEELEGSWKVIAEVYRNKMVLLLAAVYFFLKPTRYLVLLWSPLYVNEKLGTSVTESGILGSMFDLAGPVAVVFGGFVSDKVFGSRRIPLSVIALVGVAVLLFFFENLPATRLAMGLGFFGIGFLLYIPDSLISGTAAVDFGTKRGASTASGLINGCGSIGAIIGGTLPGWIGFWVDDGVSIWGYVFNGLAVSLIIGACLLVPQWNALPATASKPKKNELP